jgi:hypothetical protein
VRAHGMGTRISTLSPLSQVLPWLNKSALAAHTGLTARGD